MRAVDTNVLVRLVTRDDPGQVAAAEAFVERGAWVSLLALAEAVWVLAAVYDLEQDQKQHGKNRGDCQAGSDGERQITGATA